MSGRRNPPRPLAIEGEGRLTLALAGVALLGIWATGCGTSDPVLPTGDGRLEVRVALPDGPVFIEGSVPFVRVSTVSGRTVFETAGEVTTLSEPVLVRSLPAGSYRLMTWQRSCQGTCSALDPPSTRCEIPLRIETDRINVATISLSRSGGGRGPRCSLTVSRAAGRVADLVPAPRVSGFRVAMGSERRGWIQPSLIGSCTRRRDSRVARCVRLRPARAPQRIETAPGEALTLITGMRAARFPSRVVLRRPGHRTLRATLTLATTGDRIVAELPPSLARGRWTASIHIVFPRRQNPRRSGEADLVAGIDVT